MIEKVFIISFIVFAIHYTLQIGEIFGKLGDWLERHLPGWLHEPVYVCPVCMAFWHGTALYWLIWAGGVKEWLVVAIAAVGLNAIIMRIFPDGHFKWEKELEEAGKE